MMTKLIINTVLWLLGVMLILGSSSVFGPKAEDERILSVAFVANSADGTVSTATGSINCTPTSGRCTNTYSSGASITLTVAPAAGVSLASNAGCENFVPATSAGPAQCAVLMNGDQLVTFGFIPTPATGPTITQQPQNVTVAVGQTAAFTVVASGSQPLSYRWQRGGVDIAGANSSAYLSPTVTAADDGAVYRVIVSNAAGSVTSQAAVLTVGRGWRQLGGAISANSSASSIAVAADGTRYLSFVEIGNQLQQVFVRRFEGGAWVAVGAGAVNAGSNQDATDTELILGADGLPVVAWLESTRVRVARWTGAQWQLIADNLAVDPPNVVANDLRTVQMARAGSDLIVGWVESVLVPQDQRRVAVKRRDAQTGDWTGGYVPNIVNAQSIHLAVDSTGFPAVAYIATRADLLGTGAIQVVQQSAAGWTALGGDVGPAPTVVLAGQMSVQGFDIKFDSANSPLVIGSVDAITLFAFRYSASAWRPTTAAGTFVLLNPATESSTQMAFTRGGPEITMAFRVQQRQTNGAFLFFTYFMNWDGTSWLPVGESLRGQGDPNSSTLAAPGAPILSVFGAAGHVVMQYVP